MHAGSQSFTMLNTILNTVSLVDLHRYLPKDIRKLIYAKLDKYDIDLILNAHGSKKPIPDIELSSHCAENGHLVVLKYLHDNGCPSSVNACALASYNGHLEVLKYLHANGCRWTTNACTYAARNGHLELLIWLHVNGCPWDESAFALAAQKGHLEVLIWMHDNVVS